MKAMNRMLLTIWTLLSSKIHAMSEVNTITTSNVLFSHKPGAPAVQETIDFKTNTVAAMKITVSNMSILLKHFSATLGALVLVMSLLQYFKHRENPHATRLGNVAAIFFCGVVLIGLSYIADQDPYIMMKW